MTSESPDTEQVPIAEPRRYVAGPVIFSVLLHGTVLALFAHAAFAPAEAKLPDTSPAIRVALVMRAPPPQDPQEPEEMPQPPEPEAVEEEIAAEEPDAPEAAAVPEEAAIAEAGEQAAEAHVEPAAPATWTPARVRAAIESTAGERQSTVTEAWVTGCILEQKQRGTRDCERQRAAQDYRSASTRAGAQAAERAVAVVTRCSRQARGAASITRENAVLEPLMAIPGEVGKLATERYYINLEEFRALRGNGADPLLEVAPYNFTADTMHFAGLQLSDGQAPCEALTDGFEVTEYRIERPQSETVAGQFRVVPSLFGERR